MKIIGLTGSIGMGKTTTAKMFAELGCPVFNADDAVHELYNVGGKAVPLIKAVFPDAVDEGAVDRAILGEHIRRDPLHLKVLESFIHPWVGEMRAAFLKKARSNNVKAVVFDVPLLFETGGHKNVDAIVVVTAPAYIQRERVMGRPGMTLDLFESLLSRQMADHKKRSLADYIISTDAGLESAREQVQTVLKDILSK